MDNDWNLLDLATYSAAQSANTELANLREASEKEAYSRKSLEAKRNFIFEIYSDLQSLQEYIDRNPLFVYTFSRFLAEQLTHRQYTHEMFPEFADKEYLLKTQKGIDETIKRAEVNLTQRQITQSDQAFTFKRENELLDQAIISQTATENLKSTEKEWQEMLKKRKQKIPYLVVIYFCLISLIAFFEFVLVTAGPSNPNLLLMITVILLIDAVIFLVLTIAFVLIAFTTSPAYKSLKSNRKWWQTMVMSDALRQKAAKTFGNKSSRELRNMQNDRIALLRMILGNHFEKFMSNIT